MFTQYQLTALVTAFSLANGLHVSPRIPSVNVSAPPWSWAHDPVNCKSTSTCLSDCQAATAKICATPNLQTSNTVTLGDCTAFYWYDGGNTLPTAAQCNAAYEQITGPPSKAGGPEDCPGYVGGALGYDTTNKRTNDPVYMVYPRAGNGDCLKAPGDTSPVLAVDEIPNSDGQTLAATCPKTTSRRKRALAVLDGRDNVANRHGFKCNMESFGVSTGCSTTCLFSVTAAGWETGPLVAAGWLACAGVCMGTAIKTWSTCEKEQTKSYPPKLKGKRAGSQWERVNPCLMVTQWDWACPAWEQSALNAYQCPRNAQEEMMGGTGSINF